MKINVLIFFVVCYFLTSFSHACESFRQDVLVVYNSNNMESKQLAEYYKGKRCIADNHLVGVSTKTVPDVDWYEFLSINSQIISAMLDLLEPSLKQKKGQCNKKNVRDYWCETNTNLLRQNTKIKHLVLMRGMPVKFADSIIYRQKYNRKKAKFIEFNDRDIAALDDYLRYSLINVLPKRGGKPYYFTDDSLQLLDIKENGALRNLNPKSDGRINVGRIDGLNHETAVNLIDRTIQAEKNGIGGKVYWNNELYKIFKYQQVFNPLQSYNSRYLGLSPIEKNINNNHSRLLFALMNETKPQCTGFEKGTSLYFNTAKAPPEECQSILIYAVGSNRALKPGFKSTAFQQVNNMLAWFGYLDGHQMYWSRNKKSGSDGSSFGNILNLKKNGFDSIACSYCENTKNPKQCRADSTDALKEIDTRCAGVAEGFFGFNFQSYPVAYFSAWPTGWSAQHYYKWGADFTGGFSYLALPNAAMGKNYLDFSYKTYDSDICYDFSKSGVRVSCELGSLYKILIGQRKNIKPISFSKDDKTVERDFVIKLNYKYKAPMAKPNQRAKINIRIALREQKSSLIYTDAPLVINKKCDGSVLLKGYEINDTNGEWKTASFKYSHNINSACNKMKGKHQENDIVYDGIRVEIKSKAILGELAFDDVSIESDVLKNTDGSKFTLYNSSFDQGFKQNNTGDHAAIFLSRLNGVAFWGSISHHNSSGQSFIDEQNRENRGNALALFIQGLPLGEAAAINETGKGSGLFYGDPIYSPVAVKLNPLSKQDAPYPSMFKNGFVKDEISIYGSARNGENSTGALYYCKNRTTDFAACNDWQEISKITSVKDNELLGKLSTKDLRLGNHLIKLNVSTTLPNGHVSQFNDFMVVKKLDAMAFKGLSTWQ